MPAFDRVFGRLRRSPTDRNESPLIKTGDLLFTDGKDVKLAEPVSLELSTEIPVTPTKVLEATVANPFVEQEDFVPVEVAVSTPETVLVGIGESNPVPVPVTDPEKVQANLDLHAERPESASLEVSLRQLEKQAGEITRPIWELNAIGRQIAATKEQIAKTKRVDEKMAPIAMSEVKPEGVINDTGNTTKDGLDAIREVLKTIKEEEVAKTPVVTADEAKLHELLQNIKEVPAPERPAVLQDIAQLKKEKGVAMLDVKKRLAIEEKKKAQEIERKEKEKSRAGTIILQEENRIEALKRNIAAVQADIKTVDDQIAHREPQATSSRRKKDVVVDPVLESLKEQSLDLKAKAVSFEERLKGSEAARQEAVNRFLDLDGSEEQINTLIRENIEPEVTGPRPVSIEVSDVAKETAQAIPEALILGTAPVSVEQSAEEGVVIQATQETREKLEGEGTLEERIASARLAYVTKDVEMTTQWERLKRSFTWLEKTEDADLIMLREKYQALLVEKKEADIAQITLLGEKEKAQGILELGVYFKVAEGAALANLYAEKEKSSLSGKLGAKLDWIGEKYNGLSTGKKMLLGAGLFGSSIALGSIGGAGAGIAIGAVAVRRFCAGLGGAVTLDAAAEKFFSGRQEKKVTTEIENFIENEEGTSPEELAKKLNTFLDLENQSIDKQIDKKRRKTFFRKWSLRLGGAFGGAALSEAFSYLHHANDAATSVTPSAETALASGGETSLPGNAPTMSYDQVGGGSAETPVPSTTAEIPEVPVSTATLPETYTLTTADSRKGLWGVLEKSVPSELNGAEKTRVITSLQNLIATKLEALSPEARTLAGFPSGNVETIYADDTLKLGSLVSQEELQEILDGKIVDAPVPEVSVPVTPEVFGVPEVPATATVETPNAFALEDTTGGGDGGGKPEDLLAQVDENSFAESENLNEPVDGTAKLLGEGRVERAVYYKELEDTRRTIFATNDLRFRDSILNAPTVKMTDVVLAANTPGETLIENRAILGTDQISRINRFKELAVSAYGTVAEPGRNETVAAYTRRMVTLGFESPENKFNLDKLIRV